MPGFWFTAKTAGEITVGFYRVLPDIVRCFDKVIAGRYLKYPEMRDFNMGERQQIRSKLKNCNILAFT